MFLWLLSLHIPSLARSKERLGEFLCQLQIFCLIVKPTNYAVEDYLVAVRGRDYFN